jgi:hypothetical protein
MQYLFNGFQQSGTVRSFAFTVFSQDVPRTQVAVGVDTTVSRRFGVSLQELPLICRQMLTETFAVGIDEPTMSVSEEYLVDYLRAKRSMSEPAKKQSKPSVPAFIDTEAAIRSDLQ